VRRELKSLVEMLKEAEAVGEKGRHEEARDLFEKVRAGCTALGIESVQVYWFLAVCHDYMKDHAQAMVYVRKALDLDPLSSFGRSSLEIIARNLRVQLADPERPLDAPDTERLYELLVQNDATDSTSHLAVARYRAHAGRIGEALALLEALTLLEPTCEDGWTALLPLAIREGRSDLSEKAELALASLKLGRPSHAAGVPVAMA
jgi:tetratricopeptide (TPR) repeat protein